MILLFRVTIDCCDAKSALLDAGRVANTESAPRADSQQENIGCSTTRTTVI